MKMASVVIDCADPEALAEFWLAVSGYRNAGAFGQYIALVHPEKAGPNILLQKVPEPKTVKNRVHMDFIVHSREEMAAEISRLELLGATRLVEREERGVVWTTMADPEGNEFCIEVLPQTRS